MELNQGVFCLIFYLALIVLACREGGGPATPAPRALTRPTGTVWSDQLKILSASDDPGDNSTHKVIKVLDFILLSILIYWDIPSLLSMYFPRLVIVIVTRYSSN